MNGFEWFHDILEVMCKGRSGAFGSLADFAVGANITDCQEYGL